LCILNGALALSILFNGISIQELHAAKSTGARNTKLAISLMPDETFHLFESYESGKHANEIRNRLHWMAIFLKANPDFNGFIVSYAGQRACSREAIKRAKIAKQFLIRNEGVKSRQIKIIDAGNRSNWVIELWYAPKTAKGQPLLRSAIDRSVVRITKGCTDLISLR
jgi:hypothetical protein